MVVFSKFAHAEIDQNETTLTTEWTQHFVKMTLYEEDEDAMNEIKHYFDDLSVLYSQPEDLNALLSCSDSFNGNETVLDSMLNQLIQLNSMIGDDINQKISWLLALIQQEEVKSLPLWNERKNDTLPFQQFFMHAIRYITDDIHSIQTEPDHIPFQLHLNILTYLKDHFLYFTKQYKHTRLTLALEVKNFILSHKKNLTSLMRAGFYDHFYIRAILSLENHVVTSVTIRHANTLKISPAQLMKYTKQPSPPTIMIHALLEVIGLLNNKKLNKMNFNLSALIESFHLTPEPNEPQQTASCNSFFNQKLLFTLSPQREKTVYTVGESLLHLAMHMQ